MNETTVREWEPATDGRYVEKSYTDQEIEDIFGTEPHCLVIALLRRAQEAEKRVDELERHVTATAIAASDSHREHRNAVGLLTAEVAPPVRR